MILTHKEVEPQYKAIFTIYTCLTNFQNDVLYMYSWVRILALYIVLCEEEQGKNMLILDIDDHNTTRVFTSKDTCVV